MSAPQPRPTPHDAQRHAGADPAVPERYVIQIPKLAYLAVFMFFLCVAVPVVALPAALGWMMLLPLGLLVWAIRSRTTVTAEGLAARTVFGSRSVGWEQIDGVRFPKRGWARAHLRDGTETTLPAVGFDRLPELAAVSRGRIPNPYAAAPITDEPAGDNPAGDNPAGGGTDARE